MTNKEDNEFKTERRQLVKVSDTTAESGIKINNVLTTLVLGVMAWVGLNIERMRDDISAIRETTKVNSVEIVNLKKQFYDHIQYHSNKEK